MVTFREQHSNPGETDPSQLHPSMVDDGDDNDHHGHAVTVLHVNYQQLNDTGSAVLPKNAQKTGFRQLVFKQISSGELPFIAALILKLYNNSYDSMGRCISSKKYSILR